MPGGHHSSRDLKQKPRDPDLIDKVLQQWVYASSDPEVALHKLKTEIESRVEIFNSKQK